MGREEWFDLPRDDDDKGATAPSEEPAGASGSPRTTQTRLPPARVTSTLVPAPSPIPHLSPEILHDAIAEAIVFNELYQGTKDLKPEQRRDVLRRVSRNLGKQIINPPQTAPVSAPQIAQTASTTGITPARSLKATRAEDYLGAGIPQYDFVVDQLLVAGAVGMWAGSPGSAKSWSSLDLALAVGAGADWLDVFKTKQGPVLCLDQENSRSVVIRRLSQLREVRGFPSSGSNVHLLTRDDLSSTDLDFTQEDDLATLRAIVREVKPVLIIIDSLREFHSADENSSTDMVKIMRWIKALAAESGTAILIIHHLRKDTHDIADAIRGSGHFRATVESILGVSPDPGHQGRVTVTSVKNRYVDKVDPFQIQLIDEPGGGIRLEYLGLQVAGTLIDQAKQAVLGLLQQAGETERPTIIQHVISQVQCSHRTAADAISRLANSNPNLIEKRGSTNPAVYGLP